MSGPATSRCSIRAEVSKLVPQETADAVNRANRQGPTIVRVKRM